MYTTAKQTDNQSDPELASINHVTVDNVVAVVTDSPSVRRDTVLAIAIALIVLQAVIGVVAGDPRYRALVIPLFILFGVLLVVRQPHEGVTVETLSDSHHFAGDPEPFVDSFKQSHGNLLSYAGGWRAWLYIVDREYWIAPEHIDSLSHEMDTAGNALLWALLAGIVSGAGAGFLTANRLPPFESGAVGFVTFALVGTSVWWLVHETATMDVVELRTTSGRSFRFPLSPEVASRFRDRFGEALRDRNDAWVDIHHEPERTERVAIPKVLAVTRTEHSWTKLAYVIAVLGHVLVGVVVWQATALADLSPVQRAVVTAGPVGVLGVITYLCTRRPDQVLVRSHERTRSIPNEESERVTEEILDTVDSVVTLEHAAKSLLATQRRQTSIDPSGVALLDHVETDATWVRRPKLVATICFISLSCVVGAYQFTQSRLWLPVAVLAVGLSGGVLAWAWTGTQYAKVRFTLVNGDVRSFLLPPADADDVVESVLASHTAVSRTVERSVGGLLKLFDWHRTSTRHLLLSNAGLATPFFPTLSWARRAVLGASIAATLAVTYVVYTEIAANYLYAGAALVLGGGVTFLVYGLLLDEPGLRIATGGGELRVYEKDNDAIIDELAAEHDETIELTTGSAETDSWHVVPEQIVSLEQRRPPWLPSAIMVGLALIGAVGAAYAAFQELSGGLIHYALVVGIFVVSVFLLGGVLSIVLEWLGLPIFDRLGIDLVGTKHIKESLEGESDLEPFDERSRSRRSEAPVYRISVPASERGTPAGRMWARMRRLIQSSAETSTEYTPGADDEHTDEENQ